jgi:hypothetical protein
MPLVIASPCGLKIGKIGGFRFVPIPQLLEEEEEEEEGEFSPLNRFKALW